ncbi:MAG: phosphatase PAP2 family protein, partial [bacterium]
MPSSHAANSFAAATIFTLLFGKLRIYFYTIAVAIAISRIYIGVHFPLDVVVGALYGMLTGYIVILCGKKILEAKNST